MHEMSERNDYDVTITTEDGESVNTTTGEIERAGEAMAEAAMDASAKRHFTKIKFDGEKVSLQWERRRDHDVKVTNLNSTDAPHEDFTDALQALVENVVDLCEWPGPYEIGMTCRGVTIKYDEDGNRSLIVTCLKELEGTDAPLVINTPLLPESVDLDAGKSAMPGDMSDHLDALIDEARRYANGHRAQGDLFEEAA